MDRERSLHVTINNSCNNNCLFCLESEDVKCLRMPSLEDMGTVLEKGIGRTDSVLFTGPEPSVNKSLIDFIKLAKKLHYKEIRLQTNGRFLCYFNYARQLLISGLNDIHVSLHGSKRSIHDGLSRTPHSFNQTVKACHNLSILKSYYRFTWEVDITLNKINAPDLFDFFKLAASFKGLDGIGINALIPSERGLRYFNNLVTSYTDLANFFKSAVDRFKNEYNLKPENIFKSFGIVGLPPCLFKGYEKYAGGFEGILMNRYSFKKENEVKGISRPRRIKRQACKACKYYMPCEGVWQEYIKKKGWSEFRSV